MTTGTVTRMLDAASAIDKANTGYDQSQRWSFFNRKTHEITPNKEGDCSSVCGAIAVLGGYPVDLTDPFYTGTFRQRLVAAGFRALRFTKLGDLKTGDFVLGNGHVEFVSAPGQMFSANIDENGKATGGKAGDQTGREVWYKPAYNFSRGGWLWILRPPAQPTTPKPSKTITQMADEVIAGKHGNGHANRQKSLGVTDAVYAKIRTEVNARGKTPAKTIAQLADEVIAGKHGTGDARKKSLGSRYAAVQAEVNRRLKPSKTIAQMATEVIAGKHGNGHANRQKSLGIDAATYAKVRAEVNRRA